MTARQKLALYHVLRAGSEKSLVLLLMGAVRRQRNAALSEEDRRTAILLEEECRYHLGVHAYWKSRSYQFPVSLPDDEVK